MTDLTTLKDMFAVALARDPSKALQAASYVFPEDRSEALRVAVEWVNDPYVLAKLSEFEAENGGMPSKEKIGLRILAIADNEKIKPEDRLKALKLYADVFGFIDKPGTSITNNTLTVNRVMAIKDHGSDDDWEAKIASQQARLIDVATVVTDAEVAPTK